jgi:hypothetical protein
MRRLIILLPCLLLFAPAALGQKKKKDADPADPKFFLTADAEGWTDLIDKDLKNWRRVQIPAKSKLSRTNPWKVSRDGKSIVCDPGESVIHEMLLLDKELADGIFHVEWKFVTDERRTTYGADLYVRNSADGTIHHKVHLAHTMVGGFIGRTNLDGKLKPFGSPRKGVDRTKAPGEWNTTEIVCKGGTLTVWVNGYQTCEWPKCEIPKGFLGLGSEAPAVEFRNVKWKEEK